MENIKKIFFWLTKNNLIINDNKFFLSITKKTLFILKNIFFMLKKLL